MTTNYDGRIEIALSVLDHRLEFDSESNEVATYCGAVRLEGGQEWNCSICIGCKEYARQLSLIEKQIASRGSQCSEDGDTWYDRFLDTDISIIGLGFDF